MRCSRATMVDGFVAGQLDEAGIRAVEAHIETCEECFLRMAAGAGELSARERTPLAVRSTPGSRLDICLKSASLSDDTPDGSSARETAATVRRVIGPYAVEGLLGTGGMSAVHRARHQVTGREVAIKTVKMPFVATSLAMLRQEIEFLKEAQHPAIATVLDSDLMADDPWYAMDLFEGPTLQEFNQNIWNSVSGARTPAAGGRLGEVLRLYARLCDPVAFVHGAGMVHGDIKPLNVFLRGDQPVLMDFGLASRARGTIGREALDVTGRIRGTLPYIAPETIRGKIPDARADLYALGCMLYESIVGKPPFVSSSGTKIIDMHLGTPPTPASQRVSGVPPELDELILQLLAKRRSQRFGHASVLGISLLSIADSLSTTPARERQGSIVSSQTTMPLFRPPMVGRTAELTTILDAVRTAQRLSSGSAFLVSGESGIGKTFFSAEVAQQALIAGVAVVTSECQPLAPKSDATADAGATPLQGFRRFFESLRDRCHEKGNAEVDRLFGPRLGILTRYLPMLRHLRRTIDAPEPSPSVPAAAARERIVSAVVDTLAAYARGRAYLLVLDDLQWADDLTLAVLERLDEEWLANLPVVVVATYRSDEVHEGIERLVRKSSGRVLHLGRLASNDIGAMIGGMLSMREPPVDLVQYVQEQAEGVPFFAAEYVRTLVAGGALVYQGGAWAMRPYGVKRSGDPDESRLPRNLQDLIRGRLRRLPVEVIELVEAGAVIGRRFPLSLVAPMIARPASELPGLMAAAVAAQVIESDGFDGYRFLHDKIRETLYAGLEPEKRSRLHLAAARAMESSLVPPEQFGQIGHHLLSGGQPVEALGYLEKAGAHALNMAADADANRFFCDAVELEATMPVRQPRLRRAGWLSLRGQALGGLGLMAESAAALKEAAALLGRAFPQKPAGFALQLARELVTQVWHRLRSRRSRSLPLGRAEVNAKLIPIFERLNEASFYLGKNGDLVLATMAALNSSERAGPSPSLAIAYTNAALMAGIVPLPRVADRYFSLAAATLRVVPDSSAESWLLENAGHYWIWRGNRVRAIACLDRAIPLARDAGLARRTQEVESLRIFADVAAGFHGLVLLRAANLAQQARRRRDRQIECWALLQKIEALTLQRQTDAALAELPRVEEILQSLGYPEQIWATGLEAELRDQKGEGALVDRLIDKGIDLSHRTPPVHSYCISAYDRLAQLAIAACRAASGSRLLPARVARARRACAVLARAARVFPTALPPAALHRGSLDLLLRRGSPAAALARWREAIVIARELTLPYHELRLRAALLARGHAPDPAETDPQARLRALARMLEVGPGDGPAPLLGSGVEIEREGQQPLT